MLISLNGINKQFNAEYILKDITFAIDEKDKIGLVGPNGAGKTTLVKIMLDKENHDMSLETKKKGTINRKKNLKIGYLSQNFDLNEENTVYDELMESFSYLLEDYRRIQYLNNALVVDTENFDKIMEELAELNSKYEQENGYAIEYKVKQVLNGLNFPESHWQEKIANLSGGQQSRVALGKILLEEPDLLILDEPTNHLDLNAIEWLERYLKSYNKAFILISHDRYFLDSVTNKIYELERQKISIYKGNFTEYTIQKEAYLVGAVKAYEKEQDKLKKMEEFIRRYKAGVKARQAAGREKLLNRMEKMEDPVAKLRKIKLKFESNRLSVNNVAKIKDLSKVYDGKEIFKNLDMEIFRGDKIGLIGKNGVGKSTILKMLNSLETPTGGAITLGEKLDIAYYDQNHEGLDYKATILEEIRYNFPMSEEEVRRVAGGFLFTDEDVLKTIGNLSGGEKARVAFMKMILSKPNFIILDEPTNHLDIYSREVLEEALEGYDGTLIVVSHDRHFLESTVNKIYEITKDGATLFKGNYEEYKNRKTIVVKEEKKDNSYEEQKKIKNRISSLERKLSNLEKDIEKLEEKKSELEEEYNEAGQENDVNKLMELQKDMDSLDDEITEKMENWEEIESELDELREG